MRRIVEGSTALTCKQIGTSAHKRLHTRIRAEEGRVVTLAVDRKTGKVIGRLVDLRETRPSWIGPTYSILTRDGTYQFVMRRDVILDHNHD